MNWLERLINIGVDDSMSAEFRTVIKTTNVINGVFSVVLMLFTALFLFVAPSLASLTIAGITACSIGLLLQYNGLHVASRLIAGSTIPTIATPFYLLVLGESGEHVPQIFCAVSLVILIPWFLFTPKEIRYSLISFTWNLLPLLFFNDLQSWFSSGPGYPILRTGGLPTFTLGIAIGTVSAAIYALQMVSQSESNKSAELLRERDLEKQQAAQNEKKLTDMLGQLQAAQKEDEKRTWASKGLAEIGKILREMQNEQQVADRLVSFLAKYVGVNQGAIFTIRQDHSEGYFELRSCYAYERKKYVNKTINLEEGLVGQCCLEKNYIYLTEIPSNYVHITSGLGQATPRSLLVVPLLANDKVYGAMEFASFSKFEKHQIEFLMDVGENLAIALYNIGINEKTAKLLSETQILTEQMKAQEEEMRQNMEELAATQEQQARMENELRVSLDEKEEIIKGLKLRLQMEVEHS